MHTEYQRDEFTISTDPARLEVDVIHWFLDTQSYWAKGITRRQLERAIENSMCFGVYQGPSLIGFARVITDRTTYAYVSDVFLLEAYRGRGLGAWLMETILAHPELQGMRRVMLTTRDAQSFYDRFGFEALHYPERHLERLPDDYYQDPALKKSP